jgi:hypothetical protein
MKNLVLASLLVALAFSTDAVAQTTVKITGYKPGEFAVKGEIEQQITANVMKPIETALSSNKDSKVSISVVGYADQIGSGPANDRLGRDRAEEVKNVLVTKFPNATFAPALTKGDEANVRMVTVSWNITPATTPAAAPLAHRQKTWPGRTVALLVLILLAYMAWKVSWIPRSKPQSQPQATEVISTPAPVVREPKWVTFSKNGYAYEVLITPKDNGWESPFTIDGCPIFFMTERDIIKSLKGCVKDYPDPDKDKYQFKDQLAQLIAVEKVRRKKE